MPLETGLGTTAVVIQGTTFLVILRQIFWSRCLHTKLAYLLNHHQVSLPLTFPQTWETGTWDMRAKFPQQHHFWNPGFSLGPKLVKDKTARTTSSACGLPCLDTKQFGKWSPVLVWWEEFRHEGHCPLAAPSVSMGIQLDSANGMWQSAASEVEDAVVGFIMWGGGGREEKSVFGGILLCQECMI